MAYLSYLDVHYVLQEMIKDDNSTQSYNKMMNLFKLFGMKKAKRGRGGGRDEESGGGEEEEGITLEDAAKGQ
jgi:hypothetical protein